MLPLSSPPLFRNKISIFFFVLFSRRHKLNNFFEEELEDNIQNRSASQNFLSLTKFSFRFFVFVQFYKKVKTNWKMAEPGREKTFEKEVSDSFKVSPDTKIVVICYQKQN